MRVAGSAAPGVTGRQGPRKSPVAEALGVLCALVLLWGGGGAPPSAAAGDSAAAAALYLYTHGGLLTAAQCQLLPTAQATVCARGAAQQALSPALAGETAAQRAALAYEYLHGAGFSLAGCRLLPTALVEPCQQRFAPAAGPVRRADPPTTAPGLVCVGVSTTWCTGGAGSSPALSAVAAAGGGATAASAPGNLCFRLAHTLRCGRYALTNVFDPSGANLLQAAAWCEQGWARAPFCSPYSSAALGDAAPGHAWVWFATGDLYLCGFGQWPAHCQFQYRTLPHTGWDMAAVFPPAARQAAQACEGHWSARRGRYGCGPVPPA